jgi:hypothetical protein
MTVRISSLFVRRLATGMSRRWTFVLPGGYTQHVLVSVTTLSVKIESLQMIIDDSTPAYVLGLR